MDDALAPLALPELNPAQSVVIATAHSDSIRFGRSVQSWLASRFGAGAITMISPPPLTAMTWQRVRHRTAPSLTVDLRLHNSRLSAVRLHRDIVDAGTLIAVNDLTGEKGSRPTIALGIWGRYTDVRDRLGYRLSAADRGAAAEIALAVRPRWVIVADRWQGSFVAFVTDDQIVAELAGLALKQIKEGELAEPIGPWEDQLVQRATELGLGVRLPSEIAVRGYVGSGRTSASREAVMLLVDAIALKLGVTETSVG